MIEQLRQFLLDSNKAGYAGGEEKKWIKEKDGSTTIPFEKGLWKSQDNYFGGEPYGGRTIVSYENKPYWIMVYYGWVEEGIETNSVYKVLRNALKQMPEEAPFRGPKEYKEDEFVYKNDWNGEVEKFFGEEKIFKNGELVYKRGLKTSFEKQAFKLVYKANYMGGLVDQKKDI